MDYMLNAPRTTATQRQFRVDSVIVPLLNTFKPQIMTAEGVIVTGSILKYQRVSTGEWGAIYRFRWFSRNVGRNVVQDGLYSVHFSGSKLHQHKMFPPRFV